VKGEKDSNGFLTASVYYPRSSSSLWCYSKQLSQNQIFEAHSYGQEETRFFIFNYFSGIKVYDLILYRGTWYEITRVDTKDDYKTDLFVYVKDCGSGKVPDESYLMTYEDGIW